MKKSKPTRFWMVQAASKCCTVAVNLAFVETPQAALVTYSRVPLVFLSFKQKSLTKKIDHTFPVGPHQVWFHQPDSVCRSAACYHSPNLCQWSHWRARQRKSHKACETIPCWHQLHPHRLDFQHRRQRLGFWQIKARHTDWNYFWQ